jgi:GDPmannose 4,6-dehydratase
MGKRALITGITGMSGSYMADLLLSKGYEVHGMVRRSSTSNKQRIAHILDKVTLHEGDVTDATSVYSILAKVMPDEVYNFASQSHVAVSFKEPYSTFQSVAMGCLNFLEGIRLVTPKTKYFYAGSSESFGSIVDKDGFQRITTPMVANSPYAIGKIAAFNMCKLYRESYGLFAVSAICFNKEGPRRGENFVTRKITKYVGELSKHYGMVLCHGIHQMSPYEIPEFPKLKLGNITASRDWSYSLDCCDGFWLQLQAEKPKDYVFSSMETHTVEDFLTAAFSSRGLDWKKWVEIDPQFYRPCEVQYLKGDSTPAREELGWKPKVSFEQLVAMMVEEDIKNPNRGY